MYSFQQTMEFFAAKLQTQLPPEKLEPEGVELVLDNLLISLTPAFENLVMTIGLGILLQPIPEKRLIDLMTNHFLGVNTGGCTLFIDREGTKLSIKTVTSSYTPPHESWEWLHRLISSAYEWMHLLSFWDDFIPLAQFSSARRRLS